MRRNGSSSTLSVAALAVALAYGGGLWLHVQHTLEAATELNEPPGLIHWLRDSTLALPICVFAAWLGVRVAQRLLERSGHSSSRLRAGALVASATSILASVLLLAASPLHAALFHARHANDDGQLLSGLAHLAADGSLALLANLIFAGAVCALLPGSGLRLRGLKAAPVHVGGWSLAGRRTSAAGVLALVSAAVVPLAAVGVADNTPAPNCAPPAGAPTTGPGGSLPGTVQRDTFQLTDCPGNWYRSDANGTPVTMVPVGGRVDFVAEHLTQTKHTATLAAKPPGSQLVVDEDDAKGGGIASATFDVPGLYLFLCKVHPYMNGIVLVPGPDGTVPPVGAQEFPFIGHLGVPSLPASAVLAVLPTIAPTDAEKAQKWDISTGADTFKPAVPGVGEVWIDTQFEAVPGQTDDQGVDKPGTITVVNAGTSAPDPVPYVIERKIDGVKDAVARFRWDNPHNMWVDAPIRTVYNGHWFGRWHNKIDRATGTVLTTVEVGHAPTHTVTNPNPASPQDGILSLPLSALQDFIKLRDPGGAAQQDIIDEKPTGEGLNHPHAQWVTSDGKLIVFPNVFKGFGFAGSIGVVDFASGELIKEFRDPVNITAPVATGIQGVTQGEKAYVANIVSGKVTVLDLKSMTITKEIPVTLAPDCTTGGDVFDTLQVPIQTPVSPDGRFVATAVLSLTTVPRACTGFPDHVAIIDTTTDTVVKFVGIPSRPGTAAGAHGSQWGAKLGGGYYANIALQSSNTFAIIDPDPAGTGNGAAAAVVGRVLLANGSEGGPHVTDGTGGQGIEPLPPVYDGWIQEHVAHLPEEDAEVQGWIAQLTPCQKNPSGRGCAIAGPGR